MSEKQRRSDRLLEIILITISLALAVALHQVGSHRMVVLNLFYLPVLLAAFFLGRYRAGVLALLCVISASVVTALNLGDFAAYTSPVAIGLTLTLWGAVLGLSSLLVGTLSDERARKVAELHDAYVGVVEVLSRYLNSADPLLKDRSKRIAELCQSVAIRMRLSDREVDDIRVAALLQDMENIEVTAKVIQKAIGDLDHEKRGCAVEHTFHGSDLVQSLGTVLTGALPLLSDDDDGLELEFEEGGATRPLDVPFGVKIIRMVRCYDSLVYRNADRLSPQKAIDVLKSDPSGDQHPAVLNALEHAVLGSVDRVSEKTGLAAQQVLVEV